MDCIKSFKISLFTFVFFSILTFAQDRNFKNPKVDRLINQADQLYIEGKSEEVLLASRKIIKLSEKLKYEKGLCYGYFYLGTYFYDNAKFKESIDYAKKARQYEDYLKKDKTQSSKISSLLGGNYLLLELYSLSSKSYQKALDILQSKPEKSTIDSLTESAAYSHLSYIYENVNKLDSMYYYLNRENNILKKVRFKDAYVQNGCSCLGFGNYHFKQNKIDSANYYYTKSLHFFKEKKHPCKIESLIGMGNLNTQEKNYTKAHEFYNLALQNFEKNNFPDILSELYKKISELYISQGNAEKGKYYQDLYLKTHNELDSRKKQERDFVLNDVMQEEKRIHETEVKKTRKIILLIVSVLLLMTAFIIYLLKKSKKKNKKTLEITEQLISEKAVQEKEKNILKHQVNEAFDDVRKLAKENSPEFFTRFQEVYPQFTFKMLNINPKFKVSELTFAAYIYLGFNTKEIADYTFKAVKTIENNRYNLRKKLEISPEKDLQIWLRNYIDSE